MRRFQTATASAAPPAAPADAAEKYPQDTDAGGGTILDAWMGHQLIEEICNVITDAGLTTTNTDLTQLSEAVQALQKTTANPFANYALFRDEKASGTAGGTFTSGAWQTRDLADYGAVTGDGAINSISGCSISANQITLPAGIYRVSAMAPAFWVNSHKAILYNVTDSTNVLIGTSADTPTECATVSFINGEFTIAAAKVFELRHQNNLSRAGDGFGQQSSFGVAEVYAQIEIWKLD